MIKNVPVDYGDDGEPKPPPPPPHTPRMALKNQERERKLENGAVSGEGVFGFQGEYGELIHEEDNK